MKDHKPIRTCVVTKQKKLKNELIRLVQDRDGVIKVDLKGKIRGRGANISPDIKILEKGFDKGVIKKALKLERSLTKAEKTRIKKEFQVAVEEKQFRPANKPVKIRVRKEELEKIKN
ncbi:YlxR family protein [Candidatus Dojkabacteria bacterium]|nr:YlxR family protein [Candidatus Dojkabacteria bacterium]